MERRRLGQGGRRIRGLIPVTRRALREDGPPVWAALFLCALAVRLLYVLAIAPEPVGVGGDASFYHSAANLIAQGHFYERRILGHTVQTALHPPLFSLVLAVIALLGGVHELPQRMVGVVIGAVNVVLIWRLAGRLAGPRAALVAGAVAVVYPPLVTADGSLQSEPLYVLLLLVTLLLAHDRRSPLALGAVIGLATLARTEALLLLVLIGVPAVWGGVEARPARLAGLVSACALVLAPWVVRNQIEFGKLTLAGNYDTVIAAANCPDTYHGSDLGWWSVDCLRRAQTRSQFFTGDASTSAGLRYARSHPARAVLVAAVRVLRTFSLWQPLRIGNHEPRREWLDAVGLAMLYPLMLLAAFAFWRRRGPPGSRWLLAAPMVDAVIASATGWGNARFRIAADVSLVVLGSLTLAGAGRDETRHPDGFSRARSASGAGEAPAGHR